MLNTLSIRWLDGSYNEGIIMKLFVTPISEAAPTEFHGQRKYEIRPKSYWLVCNLQTAKELIGEEIVIYLKARYNRS